MPWTDVLRFSDDGLLPAIIQDADSGQVLMFAYMNEEALTKTFETGLAHFFSRSRGKLWLKGEESGHTQQVTEVLCDCEKPDVILVKVNQKGGACHEGYRSCFFRRLSADGSMTVVGERLFDPKTVYKK